MLASNRVQARARQPCDIVRADAVHFRDSPTSTRSRDSIHSAENSDIGSERVVKRDGSGTASGEDNDGLR
jgi:hypothetical protein